MDSNSRNDSKLVSTAECHPSVSIIVPAYNAQATLPALLKSLVEDSYAGYEVIVVDDGSTDDTAGAFYRAVGTDNRFSLIRLETNHGVSNARNVGLDAARGAYVYFCDADDKLINGVLEDVISLCSDADVVLLSAQMEMGGSARRYFSPWERANMGLIEQSGPIAAGCEGYIWSYFFKRAAIGEHRFNTEYSLLEDAEFVSRVCIGGMKYDFCKKPLYCYNARSEGSALNTMTLEKELIHKRMRRLLEQRTRGLNRSERVLTDYAHACFGVLRRVASDKALFLAEAELNADEAKIIRELGDWRSCLVIFATVLPGLMRYVFMLSSWVPGREGK